MKQPGSAPAAEWYSNLMGVQQSPRWEAGAAGTGTAPAPVVGGGSSSSSSSSQHGFVSKGLQHFGEMQLRVQAPRSSAAHEAPSAGAAPAQPQARGGGGGGGRTGLHVNHGIGASNVGFRLLKKAGWREGEGLGAAQQGRTEPVLPQKHKGARGIGYAHAQQPGAQPGGASGAGKREREPDAGVAGGGAAAAGHSSAAAGPIGPVLGQGRVAAVVAQELAGESTEAKVKRHRQVAKQEEDDARRRAIQRYLTGALAEPALPETADSNPLTRPSRLTAFNPLLDDDD